MDKPQGYGFVMDYCFKIFKNYHQFSWEYILFELPMIQGWLFYSYAVFDDPICRFSGVRPAISPQAMEYEKLFEEIKEYNKT